MLTICVYYMIVIKDHLLSHLDVITKTAAYQLMCHRFKPLVSFVFKTVIIYNFSLFSYKCWASSL